MSIIVNLIICEMCRKCHMVHFSTFKITIETCRYHKSCFLSFEVTSVFWFSGWDRHYNHYWAFGGTQQAAVFVERSTQSCWRKTTQFVQSSPHTPKNLSRSRRDSSKASQSYRKHDYHGLNSSVGLYNHVPRENGSCQESCSKDFITDHTIEGCRIHKWRVYRTKDQLQSLIDFLNPCGLREGPLRDALKEFVAHSQFQEVSKAVVGHGFAEDDQSRHPNSSSTGSMTPYEACNPDIPNTSGSGCSQDVENGTVAQEFRRELLDLMDNLPDDSFEPVRGSCSRRTKWKERIREACEPQASR